MPCPKPCPCMPLKTGSMMVAVVHLVFCTLAIIGGIHNLYCCYAQVSVWTTVLTILTMTGGVCLAIILFLGTMKKNRSYLLNWLIATGTLMILMVWGMAEGNLYCIAFFIVTLYFMWVVYAFRAEIIVVPLVEAITQDHA